MQIMNMKQTAELIGVTYFALQAAIFHGKVSEPAMKVGSHKLFNPQEVEQARRYFEALRKKREARKKK